MAATEIEFIPDFEQLEEDLQDQEFSTTVNADVQGGGAGGGGGGGAAAELGLLGAEAGTDAATGSGGAGMIGQLIGGISKMTLLLGAVVGFLALLEPIQQAVSFLVRQFELLIVPVVAALMPVLELLQKFAVKLIQIFRNPRQFFSGLVNGIKNAFAPLINSIIRGLNTIPGVNISPVSAGQGETRQTGFRSAGQQGGFRNEITRDFTREIIQAGGNPGLALTNYLLSDDATVEKLNQQTKKTNIGE